MPGWKEITSLTTRLRLMTNERLNMTESDLRVIRKLSKQNQVLMDKLWSGAYKTGVLDNEKFKNYFIWVSHEISKNCSTVDFIYTENEKTS